MRQVKENKRAEAQWICGVQLTQFVRGCVGTETMDVTHDVVPTDPQQSMADHNEAVTQNLGVLLIKMSVNGASIQDIKIEREA